jgi:hypothetical protein
MGELVFVYGTDSPVYKQAALTLAQTLYLQGRFSPHLVALSEYATFSESLSERDFSVVYFGSSELDELNHQTRLPCFKDDTKFISLTQGTATKGGFMLNGHVFDAPQHAGIFLSSGTLCPASSSSPTPSLVLNVLGNSPSSFLQAWRLIPSGASAAIPDYILFDADRIKYRGMDGILAAGYWDYAWTFASETGYFKTF